MKYIFLCSASKVLAGPYHPDEPFALARGQAFFRANGLKNLFAVKAPDEAGAQALLAKAR